VELSDLFKKNAWTPQFKKIFKKTSGIIFTGGMDIPPAIYGEENSLLTEATTPVRTHYEVSFLFHLLGSSRNQGFVPFLEEDKDYPVLGICLGLQTMNVATGGSLIQDIPSQVYGLNTLEQVLKQNSDRIHSFRYVKNLYAAEKNLVPTLHAIKIKKNSIYVKQLKLKKGDTPFVLSSHHQGVKEIGKNLFVTATSMDGKIIETLEHKYYKNVLGVQYHPEAYSLYSKSKIYKKKPGEEEKFNIRRFLLANPPSMELHRNLWGWFSRVLR